MSLSLNARGLPALNGRPLNFPPKESGVLAALIRAEPEPASKEALMQHAWGNTAVSDDSLVRCISQLRRLLPEVQIESVYGYGYRLLPSPPVLHRRMLTIANGPPHIVEAHIHARELAEYRTPNATRRAISIFRSLIKACPSYLPARVSLATTIGVAAAWGMAGMLNITVEEGLTLLDADHQDPVCASMLAARAWLQDLSWRFDTAHTLHAQTLAANPDDVEALRMFGWHLIVIGEMDQAIATLRRAVALYPFSPVVCALLARGLAYGGQSDEALHLAEATTREHPGCAIAASFHLDLQASLDPNPQLIPHARRLVALHDTPPHAHAVLAYVLARCGSETEALSMVDALSPRGSPMLYAPALSALGQHDRVCKALAAAVDIRCPVLPMLLRAPANAVWRTHPALKGLAMAHLHDSSSDICQ